MTINKQILLPPIGITLVFVLIFLVVYVNLANIRNQNIKIRNWATLTTSLERGIQITRSMQNIAKQMAKGGDQDALYFEYLDLSNRLSNHVRRIKYHPHTNSWTAQRLQRFESLVRYQKKLDSSAVNTAFKEFIPFLVETNRNAYARKRYAYIHYYNDVNKKTAKTIRYTFIGVISAVGFCLILIFWGCRSSRNPMQRLNTLNQRIANSMGLTVDPKQKEVLERLQSTLEQTAQKLELNSSPRVIIDSTEQERSRIARDMHDQALSDLTNLAREIESVDSNTIVKYSADEFSELKQKLLNEIDVIKNGVRKVIDDLHPQELDLIGLGAAIQSHLEKYCSGDKLPVWKTHIDPEACQLLNKDSQLQLYRISMEAINNILQHARCERYEISLEQSGDRVNLLIEDNGIGFDYDNTMLNTEDHGRGLNNIRERALLIGATINWGRSRFSSGSRLTISLARSDT